MTASASTWVQANHAKTGWRLDTKRETANLFRAQRGQRRFADSPIRRFDQRLFLRLELGNFFLGSSHVRFLSDAELKKFLLAA